MSIGAKTKKGKVKKGDKLLTGTRLTKECLGEKIKFQVKGGL